MRANHDWIPAPVLVSPKSGKMRAKIIDTLDDLSLMDTIKP